MWSELQAKGDFIQEKGIEIFFGNHNFLPSDIQTKTKYHRVHQVHGHRVIKSRAHLEKADAHWTHQKKLALFIQTADCIPAFLSDQQRSFACAIHIGWRGLAQKILTEAVKEVPNTSKLKLWVGPHIKQASFCLDPQSTESLLKAHKHPEKEDPSILQPTLHRINQNSIDLEKILRREAQELGIKIKYFSTKNTYTSTEHYSHRRNPFGKGRQWSFIRLT